jgi:hypothetical protein
MENKSSEVMFFLGAGASVAADVPDTYSFVDEYLKNIKNLHKRSTIEDIIEKLKQWKAKQGKEIKVDIEDLLESLTKLKNKEQEPLLAFIERGHFITDGYYDKQPLIDDLKNFIKKRAIVSKEKIDYLKSLRESIEEPRPLDIISVNYDTCIEQFCNVHKLAYQDGFDDHWNPTTFDKKNTTIRLYKLHGSVTWYQSDRGDYKKSDIMTEKSEIQLMSGEKAENLMLYPMQKIDYAGPLLELLLKVKSLLESESCKFLIVVGYSFRDNHIRRILWDAARINKDLHVILIAPKAYQIYFKKLKYYDDNSLISSSLNGKVICLPYLFEKVCPYLRNHYIKNLKVGLQCENIRREEERGGQKANWIYCIKHFIDAEYTEKVEEIESFLQRDHFDLATDLKLSLELPLKMAVNLFAGGQEEKADKYYQDFNDRLKKVAVERINVSIINAQSRNILGASPHYQIEFQFNYYTRHDPVTGSTSGGYIGVTLFKEIIELLSEFCETRIEFVSGSKNNLQKISEKLKKVKDYFEPFKDGKIELEDYVKLRKNKITDSDLNMFMNESAELLGFESAIEREHRLTEKIIDVEKGILKEIIEEKIK